MRRFNENTRIMSSPWIQVWPKSSLFEKNNVFLVIYPKFYMDQVVK
jgi:hypothetical protein